MFLDTRGQGFDGRKWYAYMAAESILYIRLEMYVQNTNDDVSAPFSTQVKAAFTTHAPQAVVIDARQNPGGDNAYLEELFTFLATSTPAGRLFHFIDEGSMSAAMLGAAQLKMLLNSWEKNKKTATSDKKSNVAILYFQIIIF